MIRVTPVSLAMFLCCWLAVGASIPTTARAHDPIEKVFVGYLYGSPKDLDFSLYTHICHAFVTAGGDGELNPNRSVPDRDLTSAAHKAGVKVLISLGGWGWDDQFREIVSNPEAEARYVEAVLKMVDEYDYDGVDLDWEYPDSEIEKAGFERLTRTFRERLHAMERAKGRSLLVTMAASSNPGTIDWLDTAFLIENLDWVNVMTYDYAGEWSDRAGHNSPLFASSKGGRNAGSIERTMNYLLENRGVPPDKLAVGLPLYGRGFAVSEPYAPTKDASKKRMPNLNAKETGKLVAEGWTRTWDDETKTPWLKSPDGSMVAGYDDAESIRLKTDWAMSKGFRGVFFWQVDGDRLPDGSNPLQKASHDAWKARK